MPKYEVLARPIDAREVPNILASPSGGRPDAVVIRSELSDLEQATSNIEKKIDLIQESTQRLEEKVQLLLDRSFLLHYEVTIEQ